MIAEDETFTREFEIDILNKTLIFHQKIVGDVNCVVWDAAIVLAKYFEELYRKNKSTFKNSNIIELGAGLGCVGLTAASLGANVLLTDLSSALSLLEINIKTNKITIQGNGGTASCRELIWGNLSDFDFKPDKIILADCIYYRQSIDPLIETLNQLSGPNTEIILSQEMRESTTQQRNWDYFLDSIEKHFHVHYIPLSEQNATYSSPDIKIMQLKKKICELN